MKIKLKVLHFADVAEIQEAVTDELKKVQKEEFSAAFQELYNRAIACIYANGAYLEWKKVCVFDFKKISRKSLDLTVYEMYVISSPLFSDHNAQVTEHGAVQCESAVMFRRVV